MFLSFNDFHVQLIHWVNRNEINTKFIRASLSLESDIRSKATSRGVCLDVFDVF